MTEVGIILLIIGFIFVFAVLGDHQMGNYGMGRFSAIAGVLFILGGLYCLGILT